MYPILANLGLQLYLPYIMKYIFNFIIEKKEEKSSREYLIIIQVILLD